MNNRENRLSIILILLLLCSACNKKEIENSSVPITDDFSEVSADWKPVSINKSRGSYKMKDNALVINSEEGLYGIFNRDGISGHFIAEAEFARDKNVGLVLFHEKNGKPDPGCLGVT